MGPEQIRKIADNNKFHLFLRFNPTAIKDVLLLLVKSDATYDYMHEIIQPNMKKKCTWGLGTSLTVERRRNSWVSPSSWL